MALEFQPPPAWLMQEYYNRKQPAEIASEGIGSGLQTYAAVRLRQDQLTSLDQARKVNEFKAVAEYAQPEQLPALAQKYGIPWPAAGAAAPTAAPAFPQGEATMNSPLAGGIEPTYSSAEQTRSLLENPQAPAQLSGTAGSPIIDHWNQIHGAQGQGMAGAAPSQPPAPMVDRSKVGRKRRHDDLVDQRLAADPNAEVPVITEEAALAHGSVNPRAKIIKPVDTSTRDQRREDAMARAITDYGKQIETNPIVRKLNEQEIGIHDVEEMSHLVAGGNTVASSAMGTKMAKAMGEVGVLTEQDVKRYTQSGKLTQSAGDVLSRWLSGVPSQATLAEINQISGALSDAYDGKIQPIYNRYVERFSRAHRIPPEDAAYKLAVPYKKTSGRATSALPDVGGTFEGGRVISIKKIGK